MPAARAHGFLPSKVFELCRAEVRAQEPDQPTLSMGNGSDRLIVSQARDGAAIHDFEDASFGPGCGVGSLIE